MKLLSGTKHAGEGGHRKRDQRHTSKAVQEAFGFMSAPSPRRLKRRQREDSPGPNAGRSQVENVRQLSARRRIDRCSMSAEWQQRNRKKRGGGDKRDPTKTEHKCKALRRNAYNALPPWGRAGLKCLNADYRQTADKSSAEK